MGARRTRTARHADALDEILDVLRGVGRARRHRVGDHEVDERAHRADRGRLDVQERALDRVGELVPTGIYFISVETGSHYHVQKIALVK